MVARWTDCHRSPRLGESAECRLGRGTSDISFPGRFLSRRHVPGRTAIGGRDKRHRRRTRQLLQQRLVLEAEVYREAHVDPADRGEVDAGAYGSLWPEQRDPDGEQE